MLESLRWLNVPEQTAQAILASATPDQWRVVQPTYAALLHDLGSLELTARLPDRPDAPYFYVYAFLAVLPHLRKWHDDRGIPEDISRATLSDLAAKLAEQNGAALTKQVWLSRHFRGSLYRLGRLQFDRVVLNDGEPVLEVHIPGDGPLTPAACDESFAAARPFFAEHFPEEHYDRATCSSWLLDPQLADYLPADSNILHFQRRFTLLCQGDPGDDEIQEFIFGRHPESPLPRQTTLQRALADHLAVGNHWHHALGSLRLPKL